MVRFASLAGLALCAGLLASNAAAADVSLRQPSLEQGAQGLRVHGALCRSAVALPGGGVNLRIEKLDAAGAVVAEAQARREVRPRNRACAFYSVQTAWTLAPAETVRVCAVDRPRRACV